MKKNQCYISAGGCLDEFWVWEKKHLNIEMAGDDEGAKCVGGGAGCIVYIYDLKC